MHALLLFSLYLEFGDFLAYMWNWVAFKVLTALTVSDTDGIWFSTSADVLESYQLPLLLMPTLSEFISKTSRDAGSRVHML